MNIKALKIKTNNQKSSLNCFKAILSKQNFIINTKYKKIDGTEEQIHQA